MSDIIHLLPDNIANQIAAGEVIQRPASVVKELVENAVDADAHKIQVIIKDAGRTLIQVIDDGKGMSETDAVLAFERHATSKISKVDDLYALHTMGFRGEALASIVSVSQVELRTRLRGAELGSCLSFSGSKMESSSPDMCTEGSNFSIKNLFYNVPARRKFLKSNDVEMRNIIVEFERVALVHPDICFTLSHNGMDLMNLPVSGLRQRILGVFGKSLNNKLLSIKSDSTLAKISGYIMTPDSARKRGTYQYFFTNNRFMKHPFFNKAVMDAYEGLIAPGAYPGYFIYFDLDPAEIDVNIHPTKTEIKFENELAIRQIIVAAIKEALAKQSAVPLLNFESEESGLSADSIPVFDKQKIPASVPAIEVDKQYDPFRTAQPSHEPPQPGFDWEKLYQGFSQDTASNVTPPVEMPAVDPLDIPAGKSDDTVTPEGEEGGLFSSLATQNFQYKGKYIVTALGSGLAFINQHRAHLRILYDRYLSEVSNRAGICEQVLFPESISFSAGEALTFQSIMPDLRSSGFDFEDLGSNTWSIKGLPNELSSADPVQLIKDIVLRTIDADTKESGRLAEVIALSMARSSLIPEGRKLSADEMDHLIAQLFSTSNPNLTPDGHIIMTILSDDELDKRFR